MATFALPLHLEQEIARHRSGQSMDAIIAEAVVNHLWDDEKHAPHEQVTDPQLALAELMLHSGRTREQVIQDALTEWVSDHQAVEIAEERLRNLHEGKSETIAWEEFKKELGLQH